MVNRVALILFLTGAGLFFGNKALASIINKEEEPPAPKISIKVNNNDIPIEENKSEVYTMKYFNKSEFQGYYDKLDLDLKVKLDKFRELWGAPVMISPAVGAVGRNDSSKSQHNINYTGGIVKAVDVMPSGLDKSNMSKAFEIAKKAGFTGVGLYPDWLPQAGLHLDTRNTTLATWGGINKNGLQVYVGVNEVLTV